MAGDDPVSITRALISVFDKTGVAEFGAFLVGRGVEILSTGGTAQALKAAGIKVKDIAEHTDFPEMMDGRVKTLHPIIHGGILGRRDNPDDLAAMAEHGIAPIDLVAINLYPFEATVAKGADFATCIENIDIGGPALIRAAAKNHSAVTVVTDPADYGNIMAAMEEGNGATSGELRRELAARAFARTAAYDAAITTWFTAQEGEMFPPHLTVSGRLRQKLRYGENPHQHAAIYVDPAKPRPGAVGAQQRQGKELSFNNLNDTDAAFELVSEFTEPAIAIIKHANPCGVALDQDLSRAYLKALASDPQSAFGGIVAANRTIDGATAAEIIKLFTEVVIAPDLDDDARNLFATKKNLRVLVTGAMADATAPGMTVRSLAGGLLLQTRDHGQITADDLKLVTKKAPTPAQIKDLLFAFTVCKHVKSNAIVYVKDGATVGIGAGQMSRVDSSRIAAGKAEASAQAMDEIESRAKDSVVASDAFFPFPDGLLAAAAAGARAVIQPGGSIKDDDVIKAADEAGLAMVFTAMRHFRH